MINVEWYQVSSGDPGIVATLDEMRRQMVRALTDPNIVQTARLIARDATERRNPAAIADVIFRWVQDRYHYIPDPTRYDLMLTPALMLHEIAKRGYVAEDCESAATLLATLFEAVGIPTRFHVVSQSLPTEGDHGFSHVWTDALLGRQWTPFDLTLTDSRAGDRPQGGSITAEAVYTDRLAPVHLGGLMYYATARPQRSGLGYFLSQFDPGGLNEPVPSPTGPPAEGALTAPSPFESEQMTYPVSAAGSSPTFPGAPSPTIDNRATSPIDWSNIITAAAKGLATTLPILERYGALTPAPVAPTVRSTQPGGAIAFPTPRLPLPSFLQHPDLPFAGQYAQQLGLTPQGLSQLLVWGGLGIVGLMILRRILS